MDRKKVSDEKSLSEIQVMKETAEAELLKRQGVTGVDIGYKYVNGKKTDEIAIRVLVEEKKKDISKDEKIPETVDGIKTDVIQRKLVLHSKKIPVAEFSPQADNGKYDPLRGGISIGPCRIINGYVYTGTLGAIVKDNATNKPMLLSNFHVMCVDSAWKIGDTMAQPSRVDNGSCPTDIVGTLARASLGGQVDCAVALQTTRSQACEIVDIGEVKGTANATLGMSVRKRGRTTGLTYGTVDGISGTVRINYGNGLGIVTLTNQITVKADTTLSAKFSDHGDSGAVVVNDNGEVVGLNFAGDDDDPTFAAANPIQAVLSALDVKICSSVVKKLEKEKDGKDIIKDHFKEHIKDIKEIKIEKNESKELKDRIKEKLEKLETKDFDKRPDKAFEIPSIPQIPTQPMYNVQSVASLEERMGYLESTVAQMVHFIGSELRPDLSAGALKQEPDVTGTDIKTLSQQLQKQAIEAKQAKDNKDIEKTMEC